MCSVNNINFGARVKFDNKGKTLTNKGSHPALCTRAKYVFIIPAFFSAILTKIIKVKKSIKLPS